jgi:hypothetical protein
VRALDFAPPLARADQPRRGTERRLRDDRSTDHRLTIATGTGACDCPSLTGASSSTGPDRRLRYPSLLQIRQTRGRSQERANSSLIIFIICESAIRGLIVQFISAKSFTAMW